MCKIIKKGDDTILDIKECNTSNEVAGNEFNCLENTWKNVKCI